MLARFSVLARRALAFVIDPLKALNDGSLLVTLFLITNVVYHPFQILRAETNHCLTDVAGHGSLAKDAR
jgi:hypothetical protein